MKSTLILVAGLVWSSLAIAQDARAVQVEACMDAKLKAYSVTWNEFEDPFIAYFVKLGITSGKASAAQQYQHILRYFQDPAPEVSLVQYEQAPRVWDAMTALGMEGSALVAANPLSCFFELDVNGKALKDSEYYTPFMGTWVTLDAYRETPNANPTYLARALGSVYTPETLELPLYQKTISLVFGIMMAEYLGPRY